MKQYFCTFVLLAALSTASSALAQSKTLNDLLVEKGIISQTDSKQVSASKGSDAKVYWNNGTVIEVPDQGFSATIATYLVEEFKGYDPDNANNDENLFSFEQKRARLVLSGSVLNKEFSFMLQPDFVGEKSADGKSTPSLKDAYIKWQPFEQGAITFGQFKTFISREYNTTDWKTQFQVDSVTEDFFNLDRQAGVAASVWSADKALEIQAGLINGQGPGKGTNQPNTDTQMTAMTSVSYALMGQMDRYEESDLAYTEDPAVSIGASYAEGGSKVDQGAGLEHASTKTISTDMAVKWQGYSFNAEGYWQRMDTSSMPNVKPRGMSLQGGYFLVPHEIELAARISVIVCNDGRAGGVCAYNDKVNQTTAALNYYFWKHNLKASFSYENYTNYVMGGGDDSSNAWRVSLSSYF